MSLLIEIKLKGRLRTNKIEFRDKLRSRWVCLMPQTAIREPFASVTKGREFEKDK